MTSNDKERLDALDAVAILHETRVRAQRQLDASPPFLLLIGAVVFLVAFGAVWWSVRTQSPYLGPSGGALAVMYGGILAWIVVVTAVVQRAARGVSGPSTRRKAYRGGYFVVILAYSLFQGALFHAGASHAVVYGIFPASAPWLFGGTVVLTHGVILERGRSIILGIALITLGIGAAFAGPIAAWLVSGIGICVTLVSLAAVQSLRRRA